MTHFVTSFIAQARAWTQKANMSFLKERPVLTRFKKTSQSCVIYAFTTLTVYTKSSHDVSKLQICKMQHRMLYTS